MNVLLFPARYPSPARPFLATFHREHARALQTRHQVAVLDAPREDTPSLDARWRIADEVADGVRVVRVQYRRSPIPKTSLAAHIASAVAGARHLVRTGFRPQIVHAHMYFVALAAVVVGRLLRTPVVVSEHAECFAGSMPRAALVETRLALKLADLVVPDSASLRAHMESHGVRARFHVVHNPVDTAVFQPAPVPPDPHAPTRRFLFVGRLVPVKGIPTLLRALALLRRRRTDVALDIVGVGEHRAEYEALARTLGLERAVVFHGGVPKESLVYLMQVAHAFVLSSVTENCPCVLIEALACGLPIVTTDVGGVREVVPKDMGLFVPPSDPEALAESLDQMADTLDAYDPRTLAAYARNRFALDVIGGEFDAQYRQLLEARR